MCVKSEWKSKPVHDVLQKMSLPVYLKPLTEELLKCSVIDVAKTASSMMCIFYQLVSTRVCTTTKVQNFESPSVQKVCFLASKNLIFFCSICEYVPVYKDYIYKSHLRKEIATLNVI